MENICSVEGCNRPVLQGYLTCDDSDHLAMLKTYQKRNGANFQLKSCLKRTTVSKPPNEDIVDLGRYHAILHEMNADRYEFLLNELIMRKNKLLKVKLECDGHLPSYIPTSLVILNKTLCGFW